MRLNSTNFSNTTFRDKFKHGSNYGDIFMKTARILIFIFFIQLLVFTPGLYANGKATDTVSSQVRCSVCGMFVAKYPNWLAQIQYDNP